MAQIKNKKFEHKVEDFVIYVGGLYDEYKKKKCKILNRASKKNIYNYYNIEFEDGFIMSCVKEHLLVKEVSAND